MQIDSLGNSLHEMSKTIFGKTNKKKYQFVMCRISKESGKG